MPINENVSLSDLANGAVPTSATPVGMPVKPKLNTASVKEVDIEGANGYTAAKYKVYYCAWAEGGDDATYVVTLK